MKIFTLAVIMVLSFTNAAQAQYQQYSPGYYDGYQQGYYEGLQKKYWEDYRRGYEEGLKKAYQQTLPQLRQVSLQELVLLLERDIKETQEALKSLKKLQRSDGIYNAVTIQVDEAIGTLTLQEKKLSGLLETYKSRTDQETLVPRPGRWTQHTGPERATWVTVSGITFRFHNQDPVPLPPSVPKKTYPDI